MNTITSYIRPLIVFVITVSLFIFIFQKYQLTSLFGEDSEAAIFSIIVLLVVMPTYLFNPHRSRHATVVIGSGGQDIKGYIQKETILFFSVVIIYCMYRFLLADILTAMGGGYGYFSVILILAFWILLAFSLVRYIFAIVDALSLRNSKK